MYSDTMLVQIKDSKNKGPRSFSVTGELFDIVKKYRNLRPPKILTNRFFVNYHKGKCTSRVIGKNKFSKMPREIATYLELDKPEKYAGNFLAVCTRLRINISRASFMYTILTLKGHAFRHTSATVVANTGATIETLKRHNGWKSNSVAEQYVEDSVT